MNSSQISKPMSRRRALALASCAGLLTVVGRGRPAGSEVSSAPDGSITFDVLLGDDRIGQHDVRFHRQGELLKVHTRIDIQVKLLGLLLFNYQHTGVETYSGELLVAYESQTVDDDSEFFVNGQAVTDAFEITNKKGTFLAPSDIWVASYWTPRVLARTELIDPQRGRIKLQDVGDGEPATLEVGGAEREGMRYRVTGVVNGTVTYDDQGRWIGATLVKKGTDIVYRLRT